MSTIDITQYFASRYCRKCAKSQRKAWVVKMVLLIYKHQKAKLRKSLKDLISASTTKETLQSRTRKRYRTKRRAAKSLKPIQRPSHSTCKTNSITTSPSINVVLQCQNIAKITRSPSLK